MGTASSPACRCVCMCMCMCVCSIYQCLMRMEGKECCVCACTCVCSIYHLDENGRKRMHRQGNTAKVVSSRFNSYLFFCISGGAGSAQAWVSAVWKVHHQLSAACTYTTGLTALVRDCACALIKSVLCVVAGAMKPCN